MSEPMRSLSELRTWLVSNQPRWWWGPVLGVLFLTPCYRWAHHRIDLHRKRKHITWLHQTTVWLRKAFEEVPDPYNATIRENAALIQRYHGWNSHVKETLLVLDENWHKEWVLTYLNASSWDVVAPYYTQLTMKQKLLQQLYQDAEIRPLAMLTKSYYALKFRGRNFFGLKP